MTSTALPTLSLDEIEDLIYYARIGDLTLIQSALHDASATHMSPISTILAVALDIDEDGLGSNSCLLHWPAANGNRDVLEHLLSLLRPSDQQPIEALADFSARAPSLVNHMNVSGNTPLHWAALNGHLGCVQALVVAGADPAIVNAAGHDPVFEAERSGKESAKEVADWLLEHCDGLETTTKRHGEADGVGDNDEDSDDHAPELKAEQADITQKLQGVQLKDKKGL